MGWIEMLGAAIRDRTSPPLFYVVLKLWMGLGGESVAWMRLLPCLLGVGAAPLIVQLARRTGSFSAAVVATAVGAASPLLVFLSNELRAYSLLLFLSALTMICFARLVETTDWQSRIAEEGGSPNGAADAARERKRRLVLFGLSGLLLVYTHYFGWLLLVSLLTLAWIWARREFVPLLFATAAIGFMFLPWVISVWMASQGVAAPLSNVDWISAPGPLDLPRFYDALLARVLSPDTAWIGLLVLGAIAAGLVAVVRRGRNLDASRIVALAVVALLPVLLAFGAGIATGRPVFVPRYLVVAAPAYWILVGLATGAHRALAGMVVIFTLAAGALRQVRGGEKIPWDRVVRAVAADAGTAGGTIYALEGFTALPAAFYARSEGAPLTVRPVGDLRAMKSPAWLVVHTRPGDSGSPLGGGLAPSDLSLSEVFRAEVPSHAIVAYRVGTR